MVVVNVDTTVMRRGMAALVRDAKLSKPVVLKKEAGELSKTLARITPPSEFAARSKTKGELESAITRDINDKFQAMGDEANSKIDRPGMMTKSGLFVYAATREFLFGVLPKANRRNDDAKKLAKDRWNITKKGRIKTDFKKPRKIQRVLISQTLTTKASTIKKVIAIAKKAAGRMKAGWLVGYFQGKLQLTGVNLPPAWVTRHASGARGWAIDNTTDSGPSANFTIANFAKGVGHRVVQFIASRAVKIRGEAMLKNAALFMKGKKRLSQYA